MSNSNLRATWVWFDILYNFATIGFLSHTFSQVVIDTACCRQCLSKRFTKSLSKSSSLWKIFHFVRGKDHFSTKKFSVFLESRCQCLHQFKSLTVYWYTLSLGELWNAQIISLSLLIVTSTATQRWGKLCANFAEERLLDTAISGPPWVDKLSSLDGPSAR